MTYTQDVIIETLEAFVHSILWIRKVYPAQIFKKRKLFSIPVMFSIYPPVNEYIKSVLQTAKFLLAKEKLYRFDITLVDSNDVKVESYCCEIAVTKNVSDSDPYCFQYEDTVKKALLLLEEKLRDRPKLKTDTRFKILLQTSRAAYTAITEDSDLCDFLWYKEDDVKQGHKEDGGVRILPVANIDNIQMFVEVF